MKQTIDLTIEQQAVSAHRAQLEKHADLEGEKWSDHDSSWLDYAFETDNLVTFDKYWEKNHG
jgi:hypothetical protein